MPLPAIASVLITRGVESLLFLVPKGSKSHPLTATYVAAAEYQLGAKRLALCNGVRLNSSVAPDLWEQIFKSNFVELTPNPSTETIHFVREALGVDEKDYVVILRFGKGFESQGMLVIYSQRSFASELTELLSAERSVDQPPPLPLDLATPPPIKNSDPPKRKRTGKTGLFKRAA